MSSNIPTRRSTRATRLPDENAVKGRPGVTRGAFKSGTTAAAAGPSKPTTGGAAIVQHKRKREALGEVTNNNKTKNVPKGISKDSKIAKPHVLITTKPIRPAIKAPVRETRGTATGAAATHVSQLKRTTVAVGARDSHAIAANVEDHDDDSAHRASKRRRTSSEADVEAVVETVAEVEEHATFNNDTVVPAPITEEEEVIGWEDLDQDDFDDPAMVSEYVVDIFKYLSECEEQTLPNPEYIQHQAELRWNQRGVLMDYLVGLHHKFRLIPETLYLAVNIIDRFLSMRVVSLSKLQLVGLTGLFIASKFEEIVAPSVKYFLAAGAMQDEAKEEDMLKAERYILKTLNWSVSLFPQPMNWLRRVSKADDYDPQARTLAKFFLEIHVVERRLLGVKPSLIAAASMWLGRLVMNRTEWTPNLAHYSGYGQKKIIPVANIMLNYCLRSEKHDNFIQKYASKKYSKVGIYIQDWVTSRWTVGDKISLIDELPYLTALATEGRGEDLS